MNREKEPADIRTFYTSASEAYDYPQVIKSEATGYIDHNRAPYRRITIDDSIMGGIEAQLTRYTSGLHASWTPEEFEELATSGRYVKRAEAAH